MKKISLVTVVALAVMVISLAVPTVSATVLIDEEFSEYEFTGGARNSTYSYYSYGKLHAFNAIAFKNITSHSQVNYIIVEIRNDNKLGALEEGRTERTYTLGGRQDTAVVYVEHVRNWYGQITSTLFRIFPQNWDNTGLSGQQKMVISPALATIDSNTENGWVNDLAWPSNNEFNLVGAAGKGYGGGYSIVVSSLNEWQNHLTVESADNDYSYQITLKREYASKSYYSTIDLKQGDDTILSDYDPFDFSHITLKSQINSIDITSPTTTYTRLLAAADDPGDPTDPDNTTVTVYVRNSQNNALLANAYIDIFANVNGNFHEVVNKTVPSGIYSIELQPTGGGMPNPDFYRLIPTAEGYNSIMPYIDFEVDGATTIYAYLDPVGGAPQDENNTFIDFYVRDMSANPISGATVNFGGYTLITNSAGYTIFEVDKSKTYSWTVSKSGYGSLTGNAVIGIAPRHTINTVLAPAVTPTTPTPIPTSTSISPNPTMTAPTGEPVSNWLEWFAAHFGRILGGGVEIGKIFMWLCFSVPVGVYVAKEAKAGAAGFMAGAGVITLFFVLIGWVPIWLLVLLALIIGLLYAKVFNNSDTGGGR